MDLLDDTGEDVTKQILQNQELDRAAEDIKSRTEAKLDDDVNKSNLEDVLQKRRNHASQVEDAASTKLGQALDNYSDVQDLKTSDRFQENKRRNAVDSESVDLLLDTIRDYRQAVSRMAILLKIYKDQDQILGDAIDVQQMRHDESKVMNMLDNYVDKSEERVNDIADNAVKQISSVTERMQENQVEASENLKETAEALQSVAEDLKEAQQQERKPDPRPRKSRDTGRPRGEEPRSRDIDTAQNQDTEPQNQSSTSSETNVDAVDLDGVDSGDREELSELQEEILGEVAEDPDRELQYYADEVGKPENIVKGQVTNIEKKGFEGLSSRIEGVE